MADSSRTKRSVTGRTPIIVGILLVVSGATALFMSSRPRISAALPGNSAAPLPPNYASTVIPDSRRDVLEPEALLVKTLAEISNKRLDNALAEIDKVIGAYPHFRLAHLIKGDLLLARARPISMMGDVDATDVPQEQLDDFRDEARARINRQQSERPKGQVPRYLVQMSPEQRHALVVDTAKSTLYVFENKGGEPHYVADYYVSIGKKGMDKFHEGDNKTPLGVYHITGNISREQLNTRYGKLAEQYGAGALPISYPNEWDRRGGRNGHGIWLHGVPFDTYSRPPRASNGCVALTNEDFMVISEGVQVSTPVIIANGIEWSSPDAVRTMRQDLAQALEGWRRDWETLDTNKYLKHYASRFSNGKQNLDEWARHKRQVNASKSWLTIKVENASIFFYPGSNDLAVVTFDQGYTSNNLVNQSRKRQYWIKESGGWKIIHEGAA